MTMRVNRVAISGACSDEFGVCVAIENGSAHYGLARFSKPDGANASMFAVTCHLRAVEHDGAAVLRVSGRALMVSHCASISKADHMLDPGGQTTRLMSQSLDGAIAAMLEEIAVEVGNRTMLAGLPV